MSLHKDMRGCACSIHLQFLPCDTADSAVETVGVVSLVITNTIKQEILASIIFGF